MNCVSLTSPASPSTDASADAPQGERTAPGPAPRRERLGRRLRGHAGLVLAMVLSVFAAVVAVTTGDDD